MRLSGLNIEGRKARVSFLERSLLGKTTPLGSEEADLDTSLTEAERSSALATLLARWKSERGIEGAVVGLEPGLFSVSTLEVPVSSRKDISAALGFELERHLPLPPEEYHYDFAVMEQRPGATKVAVLAIRKDRIRWITEGFRSAGVGLLGLRCSAFEALNEFLATQNAHNTVFIYKGGESLCLFGIRGSVAETTKVLQRGFAGAASDIKDIFTQFTGGTYTAGKTETASFQSLNAMEVEMDMPALLAASHHRKRRYSMELAPTTAAESTDEEWLERPPYTWPPHALRYIF